MSSLLNRERFGSPQVIAAILLLIFLAQCVWLSAHAPLNDREINFITQGQQEWHRNSVAFEQQASPITGLVASAFVWSHAATTDVIPPSWKWRARVPFMLMGVLFGASLWYVARRLYGNIAGYIALILYAFSPLAILRASTVQPNLIAEWGAFGAIFTAIGLAHTLYAPREVVLWNWKRILLLGLALGLATAANLAVILLVPVAIAFMWYLAPERRAAATVIMLAGCAIGFLILLAAYGFHPAILADAFRNSRLLSLHFDMFARPMTYTMIGVFLLRQATSLLLFVIALLTCFAWKRARFFGTTAPLLVFAILILVGIALPHQGAGFALYTIALPFTYVFISGVMVDLLESKMAPIFLGVVLGVLFGHVAVNLVWLSRL